MRKVLLVFNTLKTSWPPDLRKLFVFVRDSHPIPTRSSITDLKVPSVKTTQAKSKISFSGASLFNSLRRADFCASIVLFRKLNWIPIFNLIKMRKVLLVFNTLKTSWPPDLRKLFVFVRDSHPIPTRSSITDLKVPSVKTTQAKSKISFSGASLFNSLRRADFCASIVLFRKLNWIPIFNLIKMRKVLLVFNTLKTSWPPDLRKLFVFVRDSHPIPTRSSITDLKVPSVKTTQAKSKISFSGASLFNSLRRADFCASIVLFRKLNWIPIFNLIKMRKVLLVFNTLKTSWPPDLRKLFVFVRDSHPIPTRSSITDLKVPSVKTTQAKSKISFSGASLFNSLPSELKDIENHSIYSYKKKLKTYFIQLNYEVDHVNKFRCIDCKHITHCQCYSQ